MKQKLKKLAHYSGIFRLSSLINRNVLSILMYHGFFLPADKTGLTIFKSKHLNIEIFENHLKLFTKYCTPISLEAAIVSKKLPPNPIVLTFDDGYKNNYIYAFPLLKKYKVPATIFVTTGFVDRTDYLWTDRLEFIIYNTNSKNVDLYWENTKLTLELSTDEQMKKTIYTIKVLLKTLPETQKISFLDNLQNLLRVEYNWDKIPSVHLPLTWDEIREMKSSGLVSIGSHTVTHPILSKCSYEKQRRELMLSRQRIIEELGEDCTLFAYPNGKINDYNHETIGLLKESGYRGAVTTGVGYIDNDNRDIFQLNRFGTGMNIEELGTVVTGVSRLVGSI